MEAISFIFKSVFSENVQDFEMIPYRAKLLKSRVLRAQTVKAMGAVFQCRNTGIGYQRISPNVGMQTKQFYENPVLLI